jgi:hypothetical protein
MNTFCNAPGSIYAYTWAPAFNNLASDLKVTDYSAWVVTSPNSAGGFNLDDGIVGQDVGGCDFGLTYTPKNGDPKNVFFIQAYVADRNGVISAAALDNGGGPSVTKVGRGATAGYGGATSYTAAASSMGDEPYRGEVEPPGGAPEPPNYYAQFQFQTVVAVDNGIGANGKDNLTLYKYSEWWGYNYTTSDARAAAQAPLVNDFNNFVPVPEPSTYIAGALMLVPFGTSALRRLRALRKAE